MTDRQKLIRRQILTILEQAAPYLLPESTIHAHLILALRPRPTLVEMEEALNKMEPDRVIVRLDGSAKLTPEGKAELLT